MSETASDVVRRAEQPIDGELLKVDPQAHGLDLRVRAATMDDFAFIDALQKAESDGLGFMVAQAIEKRIEQGNVLIAEVREGAKGPGAEGPSEEHQGDSSAQHLAPRPLDPLAPSPGPSAPSPSAPRRVGYCLGVDRYMKQDHLGVIYQMAVEPAYRRRNVAAMLLQAQFDRSAYGTRLYCCWCKQSLQANRFWEAMGFVPLAFRAAGRTTIEKVKRKTGETKGAVHVFWQKPVRQEDVEAARAGDFRGWWYPYETSGGAMMESRVILPLPPGVGWDEATPVVLPGAERRAAEQGLLEAKVAAVAVREKEAKKAGKGKNAKTRSRQDAKKKAVSRAVVGYGFGAGSGFGQPAQGMEAAEGSGAVKASEAEAAERAAALMRIQEEKAAAKQALKAAQRKSDPEVVAYARELRDRWQEHVAARPSVLMGKLRGKYAVGRALAPGSGPGSDPGSGPGSGPSLRKIEVVKEVKRLEAA